MFVLYFHPFLTLKVAVLPFLYIFVFDFSYKTSTNIKISDLLMLFSSEFLSIMIFYAQIKKRGLLVQCCSQTTIFVENQTLEKTPVNFLK